VVPPPVPQSILLRETPVLANARPCGPLVIFEIPILRPSRPDAESGSPAHLPRFPSASPMRRKRAETLPALPCRQFLLCEKAAGSAGAPRPRGLRLLAARPPLFFDFFLVPEATPSRLFIFFHIQRPTQLTRQWRRSAAPAPKNAAAASIAVPTQPVPGWTDHKR